MTLYFRKHSPEETWKTLQDLQVVSYKWKAKSDHGLSRVFSSLLFHFSFHKYIMFNTSTKNGEYILSQAFITVALLWEAYPWSHPPQDYQICVLPTGSAH